MGCTKTGIWLDLAVGCSLLIPDLENNPVSLQPPKSTYDHRKKDDKATLSLGHVTLIIICLHLKKFFITYALLIYLAKQYNYFKQNLLMSVRITELLGCKALEPKIKLPVLPSLPQTQTGS